MNLRRLFSLSVLLVFTSACSSVAKFIPFDGNETKGTLRKLAFLPVEYPSNVSAARVDAIQAAVKAELTNRGYRLIEDRIIDDICSDVECNERLQLLTQYGADALVRLELQSVSTNAFVAGYYNTIKGTLTFSGGPEKSNRLFQISHQESEKGGLLFNSGQVVQGVISQFGSGSAKRFELLSGEFATEIARAVPHPTGDDNLEDGVKLSSVQVKTLKPNVVEICAMATPGVFADLLVNNRRTNLREISSGKYSGVYALPPKHYESARVSVEVRSAYGEPVRKVVAVEEPSPCLLTGKVKLKRDNQREQLFITCTQIAGDGSSVVGSCDQGIQSCAIEKFLVYRSDEEGGPFTKISETTRTSWMRSLRGREGYYQVIAVDENGTLSQPVQAELASEF